MKIFLSSTIHDLKDLRDALVTWLEADGHQVIASEKGTLIVDRPVACKNEDVPTYRVFESEWRQVFLLWFGRQDLNRKSKEEFLTKLTSFDGDENPLYNYKAYFFAILCMSEYRCPTQHNIILTRFINLISQGKKDIPANDQIAEIVLRHLLWENDCIGIDSFFEESLIRIKSILSETSEKGESLRSFNIQENVREILRTNDKIQDIKKARDMVRSLLKQLPREENTNKLGAYR